MFSIIGGEVNAMLPEAFYEKPILELTSIYSFYHFRFATGYVFKGERHPFWEMVYVKGGQVDIGANGDVWMLNGGDVIFHRPDEFHSIWANYARAPELIVVSFACDSPAMQSFERRRFRATARQESLLQGLLREAGRTFSSPLERGERTINPEHPGGAYVMRLILTQLLMDMLCAQRSAGDVHGAEGRSPDADTTKLMETMTQYMKTHLQGGLRFDDLCRQVGMSGTAVKQLFRRYFEASPMAYYEQIRMAEARRLLQESRGNIAAVADALGFSSPSYFSTRFKHVNRVSPKEYIREKAAD